MVIIDSPPLIHTAFNPVLFKLSGDVGVAEDLYIEIYNAQGSLAQRVNFTVEFYSEEVTIDISSYLKVFFLDIDAGKGSQEVTYSLLSQWFPTSGINYMAVRSVAQIGESQDLDVQVNKILTGFDKLISWEGYPRSYSVLRTSGVDRIYRDYCGGQEMGSAIFFGNNMASDSGIKRLMNNTITDTKITTGTYATSVSGTDGSAYLGNRNETGLVSISSKQEFKLHPTGYTTFNRPTGVALDDGITFIGASSGVEVLASDSMPFASNAVGSIVAFKDGQFDTIWYTDGVMCGSRSVRGTDGKFNALFGRVGGLSIVRPDLTHTELFPNLNISQINTTIDGLTVMAAINSDDNTRGLFILDGNSVELVQDNTETDDYDYNLSGIGSLGVYFFNKISGEFIFIAGWSPQDMIMMSGSIAYGRTTLACCTGFDGNLWVFATGSYPGGNGSGGGIYRIQNDTSELILELGDQQVSGMVEYNGVIYIGTDISLMSNPGSSENTIYMIDRKHNIASMTNPTGGFYAPVNLLIED